jgi:hypothetical protein
VLLDLHETKLRKRVSFIFTFHDLLSLADPSIGVGRFGSSTYTRKGWWDNFSYMGRAIACGSSIVQDCSCV